MRPELRRFIGFSNTVSLPEDVAEWLTRGIWALVPGESSLQHLCEQCGKDFIIHAAIGGISSGGIGCFFFPGRNSRHEALPGTHTALS